MTERVIFICILAASMVLFCRSIYIIRKSILSGFSEYRKDRPLTRLKTMARIALGQGKIITRPVAGFLHILVYLGFLIINIGLLEIIIDGVSGKHRVFTDLLHKPLYTMLIGCFEFLALGVIIACLTFFIRRNLLKLKRFRGPEMTSRPRNDANFILIMEIFLMIAFLMMNAADFRLQQIFSSGYKKVGLFPVSAIFSNLLPSNESALISIERCSWWLHISGVLFFLNYLSYSKHLHILLAFPNTYFSNLNPLGKMKPMNDITEKVKFILKNSAPEETATNESKRFGAKDVLDLTWKNLMDAYSCTECGRCTSQCPANITGKALSPRKIMMDVRDRSEEIQKTEKKNPAKEKTLLGYYISQAEIWACTTCNACTQACPINIDPLSVIMELRRFSVMESGENPDTVNTLFNNIENNYAAWKYSAEDRMNWTNI